MDGQERQYNIPGPNNEALDLDSFLYVGAVDLAARLVNLKLGGDNHLLYFASDVYDILHIYSKFQGFMSKH